MRTRRAEWAPGRGWARGRRVSAPVGSLLLALGLGPAGCDDTTEPRPPAEVEVTAEVDTAHAVGQRIPFEATVRDDRGSVLPGVEVHWSSEPEDVVWVAPRVGLAFVRGPGTATVTASVDGLRGSRLLVVEQRPESIERVAGDAQAATVLESLPEEVVVRVLDAEGTPVAGVAVRFHVEEGDGSVDPDSVDTESTGVASTRWTLGPRTRDSHRIRVESGEAGTTFRATALPREPASLEVTEGDHQTAPAAEALPHPLEVAVHDDLGNPVPGTAIRFTVMEGGGLVEPEEGETDGEGIASTRWTLGPETGEQSVEVRSGELPATRFTAEALRNAVIEGTVTGRTGFADPGAAPARVAEVTPGPDVPRGRATAPGSGFPAGAVADRAPTLADETEELLVTFEGSAVGLPPGTAAARAGADLGWTGERIREALEPIRRDRGVELLGVSPVLATARVALPPGMTREEAEAALGALPGVTRVEPNHLFAEAAGPPRILAPGDPGPAWATWLRRPDDPLFPLQAWHLGVVGLPRAWEIVRESPDVLVAVMDDGVRFEHPDLAGSLTDDGYDFVPEGTAPHCDGGTVSLHGDGDGYDPDPSVPKRYEWLSFAGCASGPVAAGGHGLHVKGTIGARGDDGYGSAGVSWSVPIRPIRVLDTTGRGRLYDIAQGVLYAAGLPADDGNGGTVQASTPARIINLSFSGTSMGETLEEAVEAAADAGALLVAAAGNTGGEHARYPAAHPRVLSVTAVDPGLLRSGYATFGSTVDLAAPGGDITAGGVEEGILSLGWHFEEERPVHMWRDGTSMAVPHVVGAAALLLALDPSLSPGQLRERLENYARPSAGPGMGAGLLDVFGSVTGGAGFSGEREVVLFDAGTGEVVVREALGGDDFRLADLPDGRYLVYAGEDDRGDGRFGVPGWRWGAAGGTAFPREVEVDGRGARDGSLELALPRSLRPDGGTGPAGVLVPGGYLYGVLEEGDRHEFRILIPESGSYAVDTGPWYGACGFGREANTRIELRDEGGSLVDASEDADPDARDLCSRLRIPLAPGRYQLIVQATRPGTYTVGIRAATHAEP